jgi:2-polyprenyl-3-methyl-5-hydroxy-6-metoxy-1,4-benzoquinol methylase
MNDKSVQQLQDFMRLSGGFRASRVIFTANNLAVFEHLKTQKTVSQIAGILGTDPRSTEILLDAVTSLGLLRKTGVKYRNAEPAKKFLLKESPWYQGDMLRHLDALWKTWSGLDEVVRTGKPNRAGGRDFEVFIRAMHNNAVFRAKSVVSSIGLRGVKKALDLGGGPGTYSMELAMHGISVTLFDLPDTLAVSKKIIRESKGKNIDLRSGDFHFDDIGTGYDLVFISQIFHSMSECESLALLEKTRNALNPNGRIAIHDFFLKKDRAHPAAGALFSVNMLVNTEAGRSYTTDEMKAWLRKSGFSGIKIKILGDTVVLTARC